MLSSPRIGYVALGLLGGLGLTVAACGSSSPESANGASAGAGGASATSTANGSGGPGVTGTTSTGTSMTTSANTGSTTTSGSGGAPPPPATTCTEPIMAADVSTPTTVVGMGTSASCTEQALSAAVTKGGVVTFNCGGPATIAITTQIALPIDRDTTIDGGGDITLDGGGATRILIFNSPNYRATKFVVTLQHITLAHGKATGTPLPVEPAPCSQGTDLDGGGAGIFVRDGILHVIDANFLGNQAAPLGPDVGGGGIYANGSLGVVVVGSSFSGNSGSDSGALGSLNSDLTLVDDTFANNKALGSGENYIDPKCMAMGGESGNGGNAGAVGIDGGSDGTVTICGCSFTNNSAGALAGALGRTPDLAMQAMNIDRCTFDGNTAVTGGGALYMHNSALNITGTTFSNNSAPGAGAIQADGTVFNFVNDTFAGNSATKGLGGAVSLFGGSGKLQNCTFADNHSDAGSGFFAAAIAGGTVLTIDNTLFANNTSMDCGAPMTCQDGASTGEADLQWPQNHAVCAGADPACSTGTTFADPKLGMLAANGGPTQTLAPAAGSPAAGAGKNCPATDQRGNPRMANGCTLGAYELP